jgi:hypothetical protein
MLQLEIALLTDANKQFSLPAGLVALEGQSLELGRRPSIL